MATLYIVGTPIGNLGDISARAIDVLRAVELIYCEDTRVTAKLLRHYEISKPLKQLHGHTKANSLDNLNPEQDIAYVSDAGTPGISDPGAMLVKTARDLGMNVVAIPGPSAIGAIISLAGFEIKEFTFLGFPPHKKGRETFMKKLAESIKNDIPVIFYEAPTRVKKALEQMAKFAPEANVTIGRELTKKFEEVLVGQPEELIKILESDKNKQRGEFVLLVRNGI